MGAQLAPFMDTVCRGLVGYVSYLATCSLSPLYSEYILYEPIARIGQAKGYEIHHEVRVGAKATGPGDHRRIDFLLIRGTYKMALEVKWLKDNRSADVTNDVDKLRLTSCSDRCLIAFGRGRVLEKTKLRAKGVQLKKEGRLVRWPSGKTDYAARWYRIDT
jgi:hypothetical protein